jgi:hypothetical protein
MYVLIRAPQPLQRSAFKRNYTTAQRLLWHVNRLSQNDIFYLQRHDESVISCQLGAPTPQKITAGFVGDRPGV